MGYANIEEQLTDREREIVEEIADGYFDDKEAFLKAVVEENDRIEDVLMEWSDQEPSVYTSDRFDWAAKNVRAVQEHEDDAIGSGAGSIENMIAYCWACAARCEAKAVVSRVREILKK